jgi:hypothetical protein
LSRPVLSARLAGERRHDAVITADDEGQIADDVVDWHEFAAGFFP